jgi:hypothetical protein
VRLIVPPAPGGSNDILARIIAEPASQILGQTFVIQNRAGAGSVIGSEAAAHAPADGHALLMSSSLATVPAVVANLPYDTRSWIVTDPPSIAGARLRALGCAPRGAAGRASPPAARAALGDAFRRAIQQTAAPVNEMPGVAPRPGFETSAQVMALVREGIATNTRLLASRGRAAGIARPATSAAQASLRRGPTPRGHGRQSRARAQAGGDAARRSQRTAIAGTASAAVPGHVARDARAHPDPPSRRASHPCATRQPRRRSVRPRASRPLAAPCDIVRYRRKRVSNGAAKIFFAALKHDEAETARVIAIPRFRCESAATGLTLRRH